MPSKFYHMRARQSNFMSRSDVEQFVYELPRELIAQWPLAERSDARLMVVDRARERLEHYHIRDLPEILAAQDCLVLNDTRVIPARLVGSRKRTGGRWQGLFLAADDKRNWQLLCKSRGKLSEGEEIQLVDRAARPAITLRLLVKLNEGVWIATTDADGEPLELLERVGRVPLPHYIRGGEMVDADLAAYQTVFSRQPGSVAAPTAGLHFTKQGLERIRANGTTLCRVTLHVGRGTFQPITAASLEDHRMHSEWGNVDGDTAHRLNQCRDQGGRIIAVGSTSVRLLETAFAHGTVEGWCGQTDLFIRPGHRFQAVDAMLTNLHLPRTTLLVMVCAFAGEALMRRAYDEAIRERYRFFSYGDAMLIV